MFPIGYHIYPYRKLFVCVNTFSRDKVVVSVLLRLSLSLTLPPSLPFTPSQWFGFYKSGQDKDVYSLYESDIWTKVWLLFVKRNLSDFSITYPVVVPTASFRQLCPLTLSAINSLPSPHAHRICWVCNIWTPQAISFSCRLHLTTFSSPTSGSSTTYCRSSKIEDTPN